MLLGTVKVQAQEPGYWRSDTFCLNTSIRYIFTITQNGQPPQSWAWSMPGATPDTFYSTTSDSSTYFSFTKGGYYKVVLTVKLADGTDTSVYADVLALDPAPPSNSLGSDTTYCGDFTRVLDAGNAGSEFLWSTGATTQTINVNTPGTYTVEITNKCYSGTFSITLNQQPAPSVDLGPDGFVCAEAPKTLIAGTNSSYTYQWSTGATTPNIEVNSADTFWVIVRNANGCWTRDEIVLRDSCPPDLYVPTAFTPNGDGLNDVLTPYTNGIRTIEFWVYDRWGELLFYTDKIGEGWNGDFRDEPCQIDQYIWYLRAYDSNYGLIIDKGIVVLYR